MHWLDAERSREIDPVLDCLTYLAREADRPSSPVLLRAGLALADDGTLPFHQIEPALEQVGMRAQPIARRHRIPIVATGFEPLDILEGLARAVAQLEAGEAAVEIQYRRAVRSEGNPAARALMEEVFEVADRPWRGIGVVLPAASDELHATQGARVEQLPVRRSRCH